MKDLQLDDSHCHISAHLSKLQISNLCSQVNETKNGSLAVMSTNDFDRPIIDNLATSLNKDNVDHNGTPLIVPGFGMLF